IGAIVVGADRIAANGDVANKIGTYTVAVLAKEHAIPFYVAAPFSTIDLETSNGSTIPIEQRDAREVTHIAGKAIAPEGVEVENPAFDVTPGKYVTAIITERGIARAPYNESLRKLAEEPAVARIYHWALRSFSNFYFEACGLNAKWQALTASYVSHHQLASCLLERRQEHSPRLLPS